MTRPDELMRPADVESEFGISQSTLASWRLRGVGPASFGLGPRRIVYRRSEVERWIATAERKAAS